MRARARRRPGQPGTKTLMKTYGDRLICVRYRYDRLRRKRYKTVEIIVHEADWEPPARPPDPDAVVYLRVAWGEAAVARTIKGAGGQWQRHYRSRARAGSGSATTGSGPSGTPTPSASSSWTGWSNRTKHSRTEARSTIRTHVRIVERISYSRTGLVPPIPSSATLSLPPSLENACYNLWRDLWFGSTRV